MKLIEEYKTMKGTFQIYKERAAFSKFMFRIKAEIPTPIGMRSIDQWVPNQNAAHKIIQGVTK